MPTLRELYSLQIETQNRRRQEIEQKRWEFQQRQAARSQEEMLPWESEETMRAQLYQEVEEDILRTTLVTLTNVSMDEAHKLFGSKPYGFTPIVIVPNHSGMFLKVPEGMYALMMRHGKFVQIANPGLHVVPVWTKIGFLVSKQAAIYDVPVKLCPTADNVMVSVNVSITFHIVDPEKFVFGLGPEHLDQLLMASQEESIRSMVHELPHTEVYSLQDESTQSMVDKMNELFHQYGVNIDMVTVTNVVLPDVLRKSMQQATSYESQIREANRENELVMKKLNDKADLAQTDAQKHHDREHTFDRAQLDFATIRKEISHLDASTSKEVAKVKDITQREERKRLAQAEVQAAVKNGQKEKYLRTTVVEGEVKAVIKRKEATLEAATIQATSNAVVAEKVAQRLTIEAKAEKEAAVKMRKARAHNLDVVKVRMLGDLAHNKDVLIIGTNKDDPLAAITAYSEKKPNVLRSKIESM